jgi:transcriptional regulator with XRE-family HTH domain
MSQSVLASSIGLSYVQIGRYETKGAQPSVEVVIKIAEVFGVSPDFIINVSTNDKARANLVDSDLIQHFKAVEQIDEEDQNVIMQLIDAFITKKKIQQLAS